MRRMYEKKVWTVSGEDLANLVNNYSGENGGNTVDTKLVDKIVNSDEIEVVNELNTSYLPRKYFVISKQDGIINGYNITFGQWEPVFSDPEAGPWSGGQLFAFNIFKEMGDDSWHMLLHTDEL